MRTGKQAPFASQLCSLVSSSRKALFDALGVHFQYGYASKNNAEPGSQGTKIRPTIWIEGILDLRSAFAAVRPTSANTNLENSIRKNQTMDS